MNVESQHLLRSALSLPVSDRAEIAASLIPASLIHSLDAEADTETAESVDAAWAEEIRQRINSIDNGELKLVPWESVMHDMRDSRHG